MASVMVPVSESAHRILVELAARGGESIDKLLDRMIEEYRRQRLLDEANAAYTALRNDEQAWQEELSERRAWEATLADGLDEE